MAKQAWPTSKQQGTVKWFNDQKGYGFIKCDDEKEYFVHFTGIDQKGHKSLERGDNVEFFIEESRQTGKPHAVMVRAV